MVKRFEQKDTPTTAPTPASLVGTAKAEHAWSRAQDGEPLAFPPDRPGGERADRMSMWRLDVIDLEAAES